MPRLCPDIYTTGWTTRAFERLRFSSINGSPGVNAANNTDPFLSFHSIATVPAWHGVAWRGRGDHVQKWSSFRLPPLACPLVKIESSDERTAMTGGSFSRHTLFSSILAWLLCLFPHFFISRAKSKRTRSSLSVFTHLSIHLHTWNLYT